MIIILTVLTAIISFLLLFSFLTTLFSLLMPEISFREEKDEKDMALIITAYKSINTITELLESIYRSDYSNYHIYLVVDNYDKEIDIEPNEKLTIAVPASPLNSKLKSIRYAVESYVRNHDTSIILDPDNLVKSDFLKKINTFRYHYEAVQGRRMAKNLDTTVAALDAAGEMYHNYVDKYVPFRLRASSTLSGSGMAFSTSLLKGFLYGDITKKEEQGVIYGEDKYFANFIVEEGHKIAYEYQAIVYDEKLENKDQIKNQRIRWFKSYFINLRYSLGIIFSGFFRLRIVKMFFGIYSGLPPLFLLMAAAFFLALACLFIAPILTAVLVFSVFMFFVNFLWVLKLAGASKDIWKALSKSHVFMWEQLKAILTMHKSKNDFLVTENTKKVNIDELS